MTCVLSNSCTGFTPQRETIIEEVKNNHVLDACLMSGNSNLGC